MSLEWPHRVSVSSSSCCSVPHGQAMFSERVGPLELLSRPEGRVALAGTLLAFLQAGGLVLSLYLLISNYLERDPRTDPATHVCTEALACLLFRYGPLRHQTGQTHTALAGQMLYSLVAVAVNLALVGAALSRRPLAFLPWLVLYGLAVPGALLLAVLVPLTILYRDQDLGDIELSSVVWFLVPLLLCLAYSLLWAVVWRLFAQLRRVQARVFSISP